MRTYFSDFLCSIPLIFGLVADLSSITIRDKLKTFLEGFRGQDKVVGPGDIAEFMEGFRR